MLMALHGVAAKAVPTVVTGLVGAVAYEGVRKAAGKAPLRRATVTVTAWGLSAARKAGRTAAKSAEQARLTAADVLAEARERSAEDGAPIKVVD
ncbi:hypothetical protein SRL2020226_50720 [Mycobacterium kiyosense]|jgi:hypothetical protein|nr:hypothetical protein SRL2020226_50720 [Mycobacterium kiyosense]GLC05034.1 hypothetical protein SRL2020400_56250 [Mycobacterium kiyosense]GLD21016.1 hypothetical protein Mkiyose1385_51150 [Mycobacterium kiyosense]